MGLLKRKRVKRGFRTKDGKLFGRGYMYLYKISPQGLRYAVYLAGNFGISREERKRKRYEGFWVEDEAYIEALSRSNAPLPAVAVIAEDRKRQLPADGVYRRFPIHFDEEMYTRYLGERMEQRRTEIQLKRTMAEADNAKFEVMAYKKMGEIEERQTPLQLLLLARGLFQKENVDPEIYPEGMRELAALGLANDLPRMRLSALLGWIIKELIRMGYKLTS
jgi:hypothetical protein